MLAEDVGYHQLGEVVRGRDRFVIQSNWKLYFPIKPNFCYRAHSNHRCSEMRRISGTCSGRRAEVEAEWRPKVDGS